MVAEQEATTDGQPCNHAVARFVLQHGAAHDAGREERNVGRDVDSFTLTTEPTNPECRRDVRFGIARGIREGEIDEPEPGGQSDMTEDQFQLRSKDPVTRAGTKTDCQNAVSRKLSRRRHRRESVRLRKTAQRIPGPSRGTDSRNHSVATDAKKTQSFLRSEQ